MRRVSMATEGGEVELTYARSHSFSSIYLSSFLLRKVS